MFTKNKTINALVIAAAFMLTSCRVDISPTIKVSELQNGVQSIPVNIYVSSEYCDKQNIKKLEKTLGRFQPLKWVGCTDSKNTDGFSVVWQTNVPLLRQNEHTKLSYIDASIFYTENHSLLLTIKPNYLKQIEDIVLSIDNKKYEVYVCVELLNDTKLPIKFAVTGVFLNNIPVTELSVYELTPNGQVTIKISDVGLNSLKQEGVEPVGVIPSLE